MLEFCPLCDKNGYKKKLVLFQINFEEATWLCESPECPWPFGYQEFRFVERKVGETWSASWEQPKPAIVIKSSEPVHISLNELGLDTPPVTPGSGYEVAQKESSIGDSTCSATSLNLSTNSVVNVTSHPRSKSNCNKLQGSVTSECGSIDGESIEIRLSSEEEVSPHTTKTNVHSFKNAETLNNDNQILGGTVNSSKPNSDFSLENDVNLESLSKSRLASQEFIDACDDAEAATESLFNIGKPLVNKPAAKVIDNHKILNNLDNVNSDSTVKCKEWLNSNTKTTINKESSLPDVDSKKKVIVYRIETLPQKLGTRVLTASKEDTSSAKQFPKFQIIQKSSVKPVGTAIFPNQRNSNRFLPVVVTNLPQKNYAVPLVVRNKNQKTLGDSMQNVNIVEKNKIDHITAGDRLIPQNVTVQKNCSSMIKVEQKTVVIDGLPPINVSYEIPSFIEECNGFQSSKCSNETKNEKMDIHSGQETVADNSIFSINTKVESVADYETKDSPSATGIPTKIDTRPMKKPLKRTINKINKYEGFNFESLKKKFKSNAGRRSDENNKTSVPDVSSHDNADTCSDSTSTSETSCATTVTVDSKSESVGSSNNGNPKSTSGMGNIGMAISSSDSKSKTMFTLENDAVLDSNLSLDMVLDDLLLNESENLPQTFGDDWLTSLFD
ncbi:uncharacterized protein LOC124308963 isoform X1 [Neodiprion virginianus]|uniref:uncharacterized protein LOC124308963 isoform X1 n=1 Tax=Neodiprion virginianus TaxID=2961670 RepID=UPI001EE6FD99|nr:uncharacterized protein LOC124308963 isoform X1 [Neodiprion virginianus]